MKSYYNSPRPTSGHHFSDLLSCPQRLWLHYYGNPKRSGKGSCLLAGATARRPRTRTGYLQAVFSDALRIPDKINSEHRYHLTVEAMRKGTPAIIQGYIYTNDGVGVMDILEKVGSDHRKRNRVCIPCG